MNYRQIKRIASRNAKLSWCINITCVICVLLFTSIGSRAQGEIREAGTYLNYYEINGRKPKGFEDFRNFQLFEPRGQDSENLKRDSNGNLIVTGRVSRSGRSPLLFDTALLIMGKNNVIQGLSFSTKKRKGVQYIFNGKFLEQPVQEVRGGSYTELRGVLTKYERGRKVAEFELPFRVFAVF